MKFIRVPLAGLALLAPVALVAQSASSAPSAGNSNVSNAGADWQKLQVQLAQVSHPAAVAGNANAAAQARSQRITDLVRTADTAKAFYTAHPADANAGEARRQEALALIKAWAAGDETQDTRRQALVTAVQQDATIASAQRLEVAGLADNVAVDRQPALTPAARLAAFEQVARNLIREFPGEQPAYAGLVSVAESAPDAQAASIARDVLAMSGASDQTKTRAQIILHRQALVGTSLTAVAAATLGSTNVVGAAAGPVVVYSWSASAPGSLAQAKALPARVPTGTALVGVCLDPAADPKAKSAAPTLPGQQVFDPMGRYGRFGGRLDLFTPGLIYVADAKGVIRSISAEHDLAGALAALANP